MRARLGELGMVLLVIGVGVFALLGSFQHPFYTEFGPDAGFFPLWVGLGQTAVGIALFLQLLRGSPAAAPTQALGWRHAKVAILFIAYVLLLDVLGFAIATFMFILVTVVAVEPRSWREAALYAAATSAGMTALFDYAFRLRLPHGIIF